MPSLHNDPIVAGQREHSANKTNINTTKRFEIAWESARVAEKGIETIGREKEHE